jgi:DNA repair protein RadC
MHEQPQNTLKIKYWAEADRPREKLLANGRASLTDAELISILVGTGTIRHSALDLAKLILGSASNNLYTLGKFSIDDLKKIKGIGEAKAVVIAAALELGRRRRLEDPASLPRIGSSKDAFELLHGDIADLPHEEFWVLLLNRANRLIRKKKISAGGVSGTVADPKIIYHCALESLASGIIVAHNHPSGNLMASRQDIELTKKLTEAGKMLDIQMLDHLIIAGNKYYSFADEGAI